MPTNPVPPDPAVITTVKFFFPGHGVPTGIGVPGLLPVLFNEKSDVSPTSGIVPACSCGRFFGFNPVKDSGDAT